MADSNAAESPLEAAAEVVGARATKAFSLLGNETRLAIMLALWEAFEPFAEGTWDPSEGNAVAFSELQERVGTRDSGQFNYHLDQLVGQFVDRTADGYQLLPAGNKLVRTVIASAGFDEPALEPAELDLACEFCGAPTSVTFQYQRVYVVCTECDGAGTTGEKHPSGVIYALISNPTILRERAPEAVLSAIFTVYSKKVGMLTGGVCSECSGKVDCRLDICDDHDTDGEELCTACGRYRRVTARLVCTTCKDTTQGSLTLFSFLHPVVVGLAWKYGVDLGYGTWDMETVRWIETVSENAEEELVSKEPPRVRLTLRHEGEAVRLTFDETLSIVETSTGD
jgi:hypothetical protein